MGRPPGRKNSDYESSRDTLVECLIPRLMEADGATASMRQLASAARVSVSTLRHYFGDREGLLEAALTTMKEQAERYLVEAATAPPVDLRTSLEVFSRRLLIGWRHGVNRIHAMGLAAGLQHERMGPAYVDQTLEPTLQALEERLRQHMARGDMAPAHPRNAALTFLSPLLMALLHQDSLFGVRCRPLDLDLFLQDHLDHFVAAWGPTGLVSGPLPDPQA